MCHREKMTYLFILMTVVIYILITNLNILLKRMCQISYNTRIVYRLHIHTIQRTTTQSSIVYH